MNGITNFNNTILRINLCEALINTWQSFSFALVLPAVPGVVSVAFEDHFCTLGIICDIVVDES